MATGKRGYNKGSVDAPGWQKTTSGKTPPTSKNEKIGKYANTIKKDDTNTTPDYDVKEKYETYKALEALSELEEKYFSEREEYSKEWEEDLSECEECGEMVAHVSPCYSWDHNSLYVCDPCKILINKTFPMGNPE